MLRLIIFFLLLASCEFGYSQDAFFLEELDSNELIYSTNQVHGIGNTLSRFDNRNKLCKESSITSLDSNLFVSVFVEVFNSNRTQYYEFPEFATNQDSSLSYNTVVSIDSLVSEPAFYCFTTLDNSKSLDLSVPDLMDLIVNPKNINGIWYSLGYERNSSSTAANNFIRSKNMALENLARSLSTSVKFDEFNVNGKNASLSYFKTSIQFRNIVVAERYMSNNYVYSIIAIQENDISDFTNY